MLEKKVLTTYFSYDPDAPEGTSLCEAFGLTPEQAADEHKKLFNEFFSDPSPEDISQFFMKKIAANEVSGSFLLLSACTAFARPFKEALKEPDHE